MKLMAIPVLALLIGGCAQVPTGRSFVDASARPDLAEWVAKADATAEEILKEFNGSELARELGEGPFHLSDYSRSPVEDVDPNDHRPIVMVSYELWKPVGFRGHPQHFSVWVYTDTGETRRFGGR